MDEQQSQSPQPTQTPQTQPTPQPTQSVPIQQNPQTISEFPQNTPLSPAPQKTSITPQKSKKKLILILIAVLLVVGGAAAYWFVIKKDDDKTANNSQDTNTSQPAEEAKPKVLGPTALVYKLGSDIGNGLLSRPLDITKPEEKLAGTERSGVTDILGTNIATSTIADQKVKSETVILSTDQGKTFSTIFTGKATTDDTSLAEAITSVKLSDDGKQLAFASLVYGTSSTSAKNTIRVYDISTKTTKEVFSLNDTGVYIKKFDSKTSNLYYVKGCFNCDGAPKPILYSQSLASPKEVVVYEDKTANVYVDIKINNDVTKLLVLKTNANCDGLGGCKPYNLEQYDIASKTSAPIFTVTTDTPPSYGYSTTNEPYASNDKKLFTLKNGAASPSLLFESTTPIYGVYYADDTTVVLQTGTYNSGAVYTFDRAGNKTNEVLKITGSQQIFGVFSSL